MGQVIYFISLNTLFIKFLTVFDVYFEMNRPKNDANTYCI